jgi:hypothetical protein
LFYTIPTLESGILQRSAMIISDKNDHHSQFTSDVTPSCDPEPYKALQVFNIVCRLQCLDDSANRNLNFRFKVVTLCEFFYLSGEFPITLPDIHIMKFFQKPFPRWSDHALTEKGHAHAPRFLRPTFHSWPAQNLRKQQIVAVKPKHQTRERFPSPARMRIMRDSNFLWSAASLPDDCSGTPQKIRVPHGIMRAGEGNLFRVWCSIHLSHVKECSLRSNLSKPFLHFDRHTP